MNRFGEWDRVYGLLQEDDRLLPEEPGGRRSDHPRLFDMP